MTPASSALSAIEAAYLAAREARDRLDVARARGEPGAPPVVAALEAEARATRAALASALDAFAAEARSADPAAAGLDDEDRRALAAMRAGLDTALGEEDVLRVAPPAPAGGCDDASAWSSAMAAGGDTLRIRLEACYAAAASAVRVGDETLTRLQVLARLGSEPDTGRRRALFLALEPLWRAVDGDGGRGSPYRALLRDSAAAWARGASPIGANARSLGVTAADIEAWAVGTLDAWRAAVVEPARHAGGEPIEPWDWWWAAGSTARALDDMLPLERIHAVNRAIHASLGADLDGLGVTLDTTPRPARPTVPVAFTTFGARPHRRPDGSWTSARPTVLATYLDGGLGELTELMHETGHAIHIAAVRTRPAFAEWPDSDALSEALGELVALDTAEPAWRERWIPDAPPVPATVSLRDRYAEVVLDAAWALFEIRLHAEPDRAPNAVWAEITSRDLGIAPHPEWAWWAMRGQLVQDPGYMANYAIGAVLAADLRAAIRAARGDWTAGDPGWYPWVSERLYRFGLERGAGEVVRDVLGRPPSIDALVAEIARIGG